ncbi:hypothetical protein [Sphingobium subterraneum]|uniref:Uncharacterized protein n=1 Tax=Sphingobium subterraneum TaxID=627688 RepID=A0A841J5L2_9SPHN|nr:hypothetical protein [Sphingobium subterraneum]MBB6123828.1 hypothetical protein [Sphingobium subterraneum]
MIDDTDARPNDLPDVVEDNDEQRDEDSQAQTVADEVIEQRSGTSGESERVPGDRTQIIPDDVPDLVDTMEQMVSSGRIDTDAFAGEPDDDDEEGRLGPTETTDDDLDQLTEQ